MSIRQFGITKPNFSKALLRLKEIKQIDIEVALDVVFHRIDVYINFANLMKKHIGKVYFFFFPPP
jgi:hypothetical protein